MSSKIYKYLGPDVLPLVFSKKGKCHFKCSYPKDFNDPYELFLTIDFQQNPERLATYKDAIGELPQLPTTCFSKSPAVTPMWAHYANEHRGVVVEIDETILTKMMPDIALGDVDYCEGPNENLLGLLIHASGTRKFRHFYFLQQGVFSAAYFSKHQCWSYEQEKRLILDEDLAEKAKNIVLIGLPIECVTALISGHNASHLTKRRVRSFAKKLGTKSFEVKIGKSSITPYFVDPQKNSYIFKSGSIKPCKHSCATCGEPTTGKYELCPWCAVTEEHEHNAAISNPLRMLERFGQLDDYYKGMNKIARKHRNKK